LYIGPIPVAHRSTVGEKPSFLQVAVDPLQGFWAANALADRV